MTITQLSNLFNLIVQNDPAFKFYHYGWPSDMNLNIQNNSDPAASTGRLFPYVLLLPPSVRSRAMDNNTNSIFDTYTVEFLVTDTYGYEPGQLTYRTDTTIEIEQRLQVLSKKLIQYLLDYSAISYPSFNVSDYRLDFDPYRFTADTRSIRVSFDLVIPAICDYDNLDISFLPDEISDIGNFDYEANLNYCPVLNISSTIQLLTGKAGPNWSANVGLTDFIAEILANPFYLSNLTISKNQFVDINNNFVGIVTNIGYDFYCDNIDTNLSEIFYEMQISAIFNTGGGIHNVVYTLTVEMLQPTLTTDYSTNLYICNDLG